MAESLAIFAFAFLILSVLHASSSSATFSIIEATVADIHQAFHNGSLTSLALVKFYRHRVKALDPTLHSIIELNPEACKQAVKADTDRLAAGGHSSGLQGIPVLLKDNIATADCLNTTAGSFALLGSRVGNDSFLVSLLRNAGAIIFGKANLSEFMRFRSLLEPNGFSPRGNQTKDPYALGEDPCGSSTGSAVAVAANLVTVALGTETQGSLVCPSSRNAVASIKPTPGLVSRSGLIPISHHFDTPGPVARTFADATIVLDVLAVLDPSDPLSSTCPSPTTNYTSHLHLHGLQGKRIGVSRSPFFDQVPAFQVTVIDGFITTMSNAGANILDNITISNIAQVLGGTPLFPAPFTSDAVTLITDFKVEIEHYLESLIVTPVHNLSDIIEFDRTFPAQEFDKYPDDIFNASLQTTGQQSPVYLLALETNFNLTRDGILKVFQDFNLDALVAPAESALLKPAAIGGFPVVTLPAGYSPTTGLPFGISIVGLPCSETTLVEIAYALEQATLVRQPPPPPFS